MSNTPTQVSNIGNILSQRSAISRCSDLTALISSSTVEDLRPVFQIIVEHIFGFVNYVGWGLRGTTRQNSPREADAICKFLAPDGPFIELAYRLMADQNLKYEFPIKCLPYSVERQISKGDIIPFLSNKVPAFYSSSPVPKFLHLNAFEYYFCMFSYLQMNSNAESASYLVGWGSLTDTVYIHLLDDYLMYFLPLHGGGVPNVEFNFRQIPDISFSTSHTLPRGKSTMTTGVLDNMRPKLFKPLVFQDHMIGTTQPEPLFHSAIPSVQKEIWRTETMLNTFLLFWMSVDVPTDPCSLQFETNLPNVDLVKSVRILVRHFHYFINSASSHVMHPLDDIRRGTFPLFQKKLYVLLRYLLARWPLDNSFRIVYETWLSYIQPWRYVDFDRSPKNQRDRDDVVPVDTRWYNFILENILFYTYLFQMMMPRFERVELVAVRNAHMLHRVSKIFCQHENLKRMLKDIERTLQYDASRPVMTGGSESYLNTMAGTSYSHNALPSSSSTIYLHSPSKGSSSHLSRNASGMTTSFGIGSEGATSGITIAQIQHHMRELENSNFIYEPLFSNANRDKIMNLMALISDAKDEVSALIRKTDEQSQTQVSWFDKLFRGESTNAKEQQQIASLAEKHKTVNFLAQSRISLSTLFDLPLPATDENIVYENASLDSLDATRRLSLTPLGRNSSGNIISEQSHISQKGIFNEVMVKPLGNPDLAPLRSDEQPFLIPFLISSSRGLNRMFLPFIESVYYRDNFKGRFARALVSKPIYYMEQEKYGPGQMARVKKYLPPRINLRFMGSNYFSGLLLAVFLLGLLFGVRGFGWILWPALAVLLYGAMRAVFEPPNHLHNVITEFSGSLDFASNFQFDTFLSDDNPLVNLD